MQAILKGVVVKSLPAEKWQVFWNNIGRTSDHRKNTLQYMSKRDKTSSSETLGALDREDIYLGDQDDLKKYTTATSAQKSTGNNDASLRTTATPAPVSIINDLGDGFQNHTANARNCYLPTSTRYYTSLDTKTFDTSTTSTSCCFIG